MSLANFLLSCYLAGVQTLVSARAVIVMPDLDTQLHLNMLRDFRREKIPVYQAERRGYAERSELERALRSGELPYEHAEKGVRLVRVSDLERLYGRPRGEIYGMHWGDPETVQPLNFIKNSYVMPHVKPEGVGLEIGPGGGRWTQYLTRMKRLYVVDYHKELLAEFSRAFKAPNIISIQNNGSDFPGVPDGEIDFLMSFDVFVHLEPHLIEDYLNNMMRVLKGDAIVLLHYSDKTKIMAQINPGFAETTPEIMRHLVLSAGYEILQEDTTTMWHSSIIMFRPAR
jgi:phospholipid N-methyltransferase